MILYTFAGAPSPTRVALYLAEKDLGGHAIDLCTVAVDLQAGEQVQATHLARNKFGRVPVLETDDGHFLAESAAIIEYLEELFPAPRLLGSTPFERASTRELDRIVELRVFLPLGRLVHAANSPVGRRADSAVVAHYREMLPRGLSFIDSKLSDERHFLGGDTVSTADCTLAAAIDFAICRGVDAHSNYRWINAWFKSYRARMSGLNILFSADYATVHTE